MRQKRSFHLVTRPMTTVVHHRNGTATLRGRHNNMPVRPYHRNQSARGIPPEDSCPGCTLIETGEHERSCPFIARANCCR